MSRKTTQESAEMWLAAHAPHISLMHWGGDASAQSRFKSSVTGYEFVASFRSVKSRVKRGIAVGNRLPTTVGNHNISSVINDYLYENVPHIKLINCADKISDKSTFLNTETNREFEFSFSNLKYQIEHGNDVGVGLSEAAKRLNKTKQTPVEEAKSWLSINCPHISIVKWGGNWSVETQFYNNKTGRYFYALLKNLRTTLNRGGLPYGKQSGLEDSLGLWFKFRGINYISNRVIKPGIPYRPDFLLPEHKLVIECDGLYWHSDLHKDKEYHKEKLDAYESLGYRALFFRGNEIRDKSHVVESIINNAINLNTKKIYARQCTVRPAFAAFFEKNHLMGKGAGRCYGLYYDNILVAAIQVKWQNKEDRLLDISRFCTALDTTVVGGYSRLIKHVERVEAPKYIQTFIDRRYGVGDYLYGLGFTKATDALSFKWTDFQDTYGRMQYPGNTGYDYGLQKIWDCGQLKFVKEVQ